MQSAYDNLIRILREIDVIRSANALLSWDQQTHLPSGAGEDRARQMSMLSRLAHERFVSEELGELLDSIIDATERNSLAPEIATVVRETKRLYDREKKLPTDLVEQMSHDFSRGYQGWEEAYQKSDFAIFAPFLEKNIANQRQAAEVYGYVENNYDALLEGYEPGMTTSRLNELFTGLKEAVVPLRRAIVERHRSAGSVELPAGRGSPQSQEEFVTEVLRTIGFDSTIGRFDASTHPFTTRISAADTRLAIWREQHDTPLLIRAILHEFGHGLYRQSFDRALWGSPMAEIASHGIDESVARLWGDMIGGSRELWQLLFPRIRATFFHGQSEIELDRVYEVVTAVQPGKIRVKADEVTYNLHILLRFELERDLLNGRISVPELPSIWNRKMEEYLGVTPENDNEGVLQDPHWSDSPFAYFPTYTLGTIYAAQFYEALTRDVPDVRGLIFRGDFTPICGWLRDNIFRHGMRYRPTELVELACGSPVSVEPLIQYLTHKFADAK